MASQQRIHICFYSNRCPWSKAFIEEISKTPWKQEFQYVCVDPGPNRPQLPKWLEKTPTLVIRGEKEPRIDAEVMNWLYERKMKEPSSQQGSQPTQRKDPAATEEPEAWSSSEFGVGLYSSSGAGSDYSFINDDTNTGGNGGSSIPGSFSFLHGQAGPGARGVDLYPGGAGAEKKTKREQMFDSQMEEYMKHRDNGMPKGPARI
jgi:hypothetical protein